VIARPPACTGGGRHRRESAQNHLGWGQRIGRSAIGVAGPTRHEYSIGFSAAFADFIQEKQSTGQAWTGLQNVQWCLPLATC
jgi:hypothetical protein